MQIEAFLNYVKPQYSFLNEIFNTKIRSYKDKLYLYLDLDSLIAPLFTDDFLNDITNNLKGKKYYLTSNLTNTIGYIRHYFASKYNKDTIIFLNYSFSDYDENSEYKKNYNIKHGIIETQENEKNRYLHKYIINELKFLEIIVKYIPDAYLINGHNISAFKLPYIIYENFCENKDDASHIIIANKVLFYQYDVKKFNILRFKNSNTDLLTEINAVEKINKSKTKYDIPYQFIKFINIMTGYDSYSINGLPKVGTARAMKKLLEFKNNDLINESSIYLSTALKDKEEYVDILELISKNEEYFLLEKENSVLTAETKQIISNQIIDLYDPKGLKDINTKFLAYCPILLDYLFE